MLAAAVALAAAGGGTVGFGAPTWLAGAVAAAAALAAGTVVDRSYHARDERAAAQERRGQVLDELRQTACVDRGDVLGLLRADRSPVPFRGRGRELRQLAAWYTEELVSPVLLLGGPAGVGKSRLALEFGLRLPKGWAAGWLHAGMGGEAVGAVRGCGDPAVILVDDADGRADLLPLLESLAEQHRDPVIRVVLVSRSAVGLRAALAARLEERHAWLAAGAAELDLGPEGGQEDWTRWFGEAVRAFAEALGIPVPTLPNRFSPGPAGAVPPFVVLQAQALLAVLDTGQDQPDPRDLPFRQVADALMSHEQRRWRAIAATWDWGGGGPPSPDVQERSVAALCLLGADSDAEAREVLQRVPELQDATGERLAGIASWIWALYPPGPGFAPRIRPEMIGEWFVVSQLTAHPDLARSLRAGLTDDQAARALGLLARAADRIQAAGPLFADFASDDLRRRVMAAALAALTGETGRHLLDAIIAGQLRSAGDWTLDQLTELKNLLPEHVLLLTNVAIAELLVTLHRALAADHPAANQPDLATALGNLGIHLGRLGRHREALEASQEAVTLYRVLAADNPAAHEPDLAIALDNLGAYLYKFGRHREALEATQEGVTLLRALAADNPAAHQPHLAIALNNLGTYLNQFGRHREALEASQEAVTLLRALAADNPGHQPHLAEALNNLGIRLNHLGRLQEALEATQEAVTLLQPLATDNPAHQPDLAAALNNLGTYLDHLGRHQEALAARTESVRVYRELASSNPDLYQAEYRRRLGTLQREYDQRGMQYEAITHDLVDPAD